MREHFEAWARKEGLDVSRHENNGFYFSRVTYIAWKAFKEGVISDF